jgi:hypothetical protein
VLTRTVAIAIRLTRRGLVTLGDYTSEGENRREVEGEKRSAHRVDLSLRAVGGADEDGCAWVDESWSYHAG